MFQDVFIGRQPIYGRDLQLHGYELLYRGGDMDFADFTEGDRATSQVLLNTFTELGLDRVVGQNLAFINLTRGFIIGEYPLPVPREQVVLEVLEDIEPDTEVLQGLRDLKRRGFTLALDDLVSTEGNEEFLELADLVKVDVLDMTDDEIRQKSQELRAYNTKILAEKIETRERFQLCLDAGFDYFQGYFLARPNIVQGGSISASNLSLLRLLSVIQDPDCDFDVVQDIISQHVTLSYKLLRHINAALYGMPRRIDSIRETVVYLGLSTIKNLASLFLLSTATETPHDLIMTSMLRAKMCERLGMAAGFRDPQVFFTVGLFSTLDVLMGAPMSKVISKLPLTEEVSLALLDGNGRLGEALRATIAYERGEWEFVSSFSLSRGEIKGAFFEAVRWVEQVDRELSAIAA